jgi:hypothetical protein
VLKIVSIITTNINKRKRTFQIIRLPQYSNLILTSDITTPPFNGTVVVLFFSVAGTFDFNGKTIDGNARGSFRGGYSPVDKSIENNSTDYVGLASNTATSGGEELPEHLDLC